MPTVTITVDYQVGGFPVYAHVPSTPSQFFGDVMARSWADGAFVYYPGPFGHPEVRWDDAWAQAIIDYPDGLHTIISPKQLDEAALDHFCQQLPQSWRDKMIFEFYQEPEANLTTPDEKAWFRDNVHRAGLIVRPYGIRNGLELTDWTLNPVNNNPWAGAENLAEFVNEPDVDIISWSMYEKNLKDRALDRVTNVTDFMARYPSLEWDAAACGIAVPPDATQTQRELRADLTRTLIDTVKGHGGVAFGWFDHLWGSYDYRTMTDPLLTAVLNDY